MRPHAAGPPSDRFATTGPRTLKPPTSIALMKAKPVTMTQSQVRDRNSVQPSASSDEPGRRRAGDLGQVEREPK
jgi:hypothetical protein